MADVMPVVEESKHIETPCKESAPCDLDRTVKDAPDCSMAQTHSGTRLSWQDVRFNVGSKTILKGVSGSTSPGLLCAIMGPSGAGKSTLMNILAGRLSTRGNLQVAGKVLSNGRLVDTRSPAFRRSIAYVMQEDALFATQTPREALTFSAALRLPATLGEAERKKLVEEMIVALSLEKCADTIVGNVLIKGLSGGEKKRTAIAVELISNPSVLFLDEPTSGLDSYAAFQVVKIIRTLARTGRTVVTTIHQPSSEVFAMFDQTLLLADGRLVYHDDVSALTTYLAGVGHECPTHFNPADFAMFAMQQATKEELEKLATSWEEHAKAKGRDQALEDGAAASDKALQSEGSEAEQTAGFCAQFVHLVKREAKNVVRDKQTLGAMIGTTLFLNLLNGLIFKDAANWKDVDTHSIPEVISKTNAAFGALVYVAIGALFGLSQSVMLAFPLERPIFLREYSTGTYGSVPYVLSKILVEVPMAIAQAALIFLSSYHLIGFSANFFLVTLVTALLGLVAASTAMVIGALSDNVTTAVQASPLLFVPQLLFAGFFVAIKDIPVYLRWAQYLCSLKYSINLVMLLEFDTAPRTWPEDEPLDTYNYAIYGCTSGIEDGACINTDSSVIAVPNSTETVTLYNPNAMLPRSDVEPAKMGVYLGILLAILFLFRMVALIALTAKAKRL